MLADMLTGFVADPAPPNPIRQFVKHEVNLGSVNHRLGNVDNRPLRANDAAVAIVRLPLPARLTS